MANFFAFTLGRGFVSPSAWIGRSGRIEAGEDYEPLVKLVGQHEVRPSPMRSKTAWIHGGAKIEVGSSVKAELVNGEWRFGIGEEDDYIYILVEGRRGDGHNHSREVILPDGIEILITGAKASHAEGSCNKETRILFRVLKTTRKLLFSEGSREHRQFRQDIYPDMVVTLEVGEDGCTASAATIGQFQSEAGKWDGLWAKFKPKPSSITKEGYSVFEFDKKEGHSEGWIKEPIPALMV